MSAGDGHTTTNSALIETVAGPISPGELGRTLVHEHLRTAREPVYVQFPHLDDESGAVGRVVEQVRTVQKKGVRTIVDPTVLGLDPRIRFVERVVRETGMQVAVATGAYIYEKLPPYFATRSADALADAFVHDIEVGVQGTAIKAAFIKCATDVAGVTPDVEKVLRAAARAHRRTGAPIMTHSYPPNGSGLEQQRIFKDEGVDLRQVQIGHSGDSDDLGYLRALADAGSFLGMDRFGMDDFLSTERRVATVVALVRNGYAGSLM